LRGLNSIFPPWVQMFPKDEILLVGSSCPVVLPGLSSNGSGGHFPTPEFPISMDQVHAFYLYHPIRHVSPLQFTISCHVHILYHPRAYATFCYFISHLLGHYLSAAWGVSCGPATPEPKVVSYPLRPCSELITRRILPCMCTRALEASPITAVSLSVSCQPFENHRPRIHSFCTVKQDAPYRYSRQTLDWIACLKINHTAPPLPYLTYSLSSILL